MEAMEVGTTCNASTQHGITGQQLNCTRMICFTRRQDIPGINLDIPCIYQTKVTCQRGPAVLLTLVWQLSGFGPGPTLDLLGLGHREAAHARLGPSKVPQPGVDLVNMATTHPHHRHSRTLKRPSVCCFTCVE